MRSLFIVFAVTCAVSSSAWAEYSLTWSPTSQTSTGAPITVDLFLNESGTSNIANFGVSGASYQVIIAGVGALEVPIGNTDFVSNTSELNGAIATVVQTSIDGVRVSLPNVNSLKIGTFTINPTGVGNGTLTVGLLDPTSGADFTVFTDNDPMVLGQEVLDDMLFPNMPQPPNPLTFNFEFTAVPEPSSALTGVALFSGFLAMRRRRRCR